MSEAQTSTSMASDLKRRVPSAIAMIVIALGATWYGGFPFLLFWTLAALIVWFEWVTVVRSEPKTTIIALGAIAIALAAVLIGIGYLTFAVWIVFVAALACAVATNGDRAARIWSGSGVFYAALVFVPGVLLREDPKFGFLAIVWLYAVVWLTDIAAYFFGRFIGGPKLAPTISPKKTWSGAIGGTLFGVLGGVAVATIANARFAATAIVVAFVISVVSQAGDIFESFVKRKFGKKDSSGILPGHGGVMDRIDGFIAAAAIALLIGIAHGGVKAPASGLLAW